MDMKRIFRYMIMAAASVFVAAGCQNEDLVQIDPDEVIVPVLHDPGFPALITITPSNQTEEISFTWDAAHVGFGAQMNYAIEIYLDENGKKSALSGGVSSTTATVKYEDINYALVYGLGAVPLETVNVKFCLSAAVGVKKFYSKPISVNIIPTNAPKQFPHIHFIGSYCGWNHTETQLLYDFAENGLKYQGVVDLGENFMSTTSEGFKLTPDANWNAEWSDPAAWEEDYLENIENGTLPVDPAEIQFGTSGGNCLRYSESHRFYHFTLSAETNMFTMEAAFDKATLIFDGEETELAFHPAKHSQYFYTDVTVKAESKFTVVLDDQANTVFCADETDTEGLLVIADGTAKDVTVPVEPGNYRLYINMNDWGAVTYEFDSEKYGTEEGSGVVVETYKGWGICGYMNKWKGDIPMEFDGQSWWVAKRVYLEYDYDFMFRKDGASAIVFKGGTFNVNTPTWLSRSAGDIIVPKSGYYDIYLNPTNGCCWFIDNGSAPTEGMCAQRPDDAADWSICGSMNEWGENGAADVWMYREGEYFAVKNLSLEAGAEFKLRNLCRFELGDKTVPVSSVQAGYYYPVQDGNGFGNIHVDQAGTYDIYVTVDMKYIYILEAGASVEDAVFIFPPKPENAAPWSICGTFVGWGDWWMTEEGDYYVAKGVKLSDTDRFKFRYMEGWDQNRGGAGIAEQNCWYSLTQGGADIFVMERGTYDIYLAKSLDKFYLMEEGVLPSEAQDGMAGLSRWAVSGQFNDWGDRWMKEDGDFYVAKKVNITGGAFKFRYDGGWALNYGASVFAAADCWYAVTKGGADINVELTGVYDIYLSKTFDKFYLMTPGTSPSEAKDGSSVVVDSVDMTIYGKTSYANLYCWYTGTSNTLTASWPGDAFQGEETVDGVKYKKWVLTVPKAQFGKSKIHFIFNGNGGQTADSDAYDMAETMFLVEEGGKPVLKK